jgi:hypothetical protein
VNSLANTHRLFEAKVRAHKRQWNRNAKPESQQSNKGAKWYCCTTSQYPQNQVENKEYGKDNSGTVTQISNNKNLVHTMLLGMNQVSKKCA